MTTYKRFRAENIAPKNAKDIGIYKDGQKVGRIPLGVFAPPSGTPLYSFGVISDTHIDETATKTEYMLTAIQNMKKHDVDFIINAGDLVDDGRVKTHWEQYEEILKTLDGTDLFSIPGNHEWWKEDYVRPWGKLYANLDEATVWDFEIKNDLFIMCGTYGYHHNAADSSKSTQIMLNDDLQRMRTLMNKNKNRRAFIFQHVRPPLGQDHNSDIDTYPSGGFMPVSFYRHFKNAIVFHGHSHGEFERQDSSSLQETYMTKYKQNGEWVDLGFRGVHIPSLGYKKQGYIVDVYEDGFHLRGMDLVENKDIGIAHYWIDTPLVEVNSDY